MLDLNGTPSPGSNPLTLPTHLSWTYDFNTSAGGVCRARRFRSGCRNARSQMDPGRSSSRRNPGVGQGDRHIPGTHQHKSARESGLQIDFIAVRLTRRLVTRELKNVQLPADRSDAWLRRGTNKLRGSVQSMQPQNPSNRDKATLSPGTGKPRRPRRFLSSHPLGPSLPGKHYPAARRRAVRADPLSTGHAATHRGGSFARVVHRQGLRHIHHRCRAGSTLSRSPSTASASR